MYSTVRKIKASYVDHPLWNDSIELTSEEINELKLKLIDGDTSVIDPLIRSHIKLAINIVGKMVTASGKQHMDDLISVTMLAMVDCCQRVKDKEVDYENITSYFGGRMYSRCSHYVQDSNMVGPKHEQRRKTGHPGFIVYSISPNETIVSHSDIELLDTIEHCCETQTQKQIIDLKIQGYTSKEISEQLGIPQSSLSVELNAFKTRLRDALCVDLNT